MAYGGINLLGSRLYGYGKDYARDWLTSGNWSKSDQEIFDFLYDQNYFGFAPFRSMFDDILNEKNFEFYSKVNQIDYSDITDPRKFHNSFGQSHFVTGGVNFMSSNIKRLYKD